MYSLHRSIYRRISYNLGATQVATKDTNMDTKHITVCAIRKNAYKLKNPSYYARVKVDGKTREVPLNTTSKDVADAWVRLRRDEIKKYNDYITSGETPPNGLLDKLIPAGAKPTGKQVTVQEAVDAWEIYMKRIGRRPRTIELYCKDVRRTLEPDMRISGIDSKNLNRSLSKHDPLKSATRKLYSVALREFVKFLVMEYGLDRNLIDCFTFIKVHQEERGYWLPKQVRNIVEHVKCKDPVVEHNYKAYFWFLFITGARQGEGGLVEWTDIRDGFVTLRAENTKTNKTRRIPLTAGLMALLKTLPHDSKLVFSHIGKIQPARYDVLKRAARLAGEPNYGLHGFRRSASYYIYTHVGDLKIASQILGDSPSTMMQYYQKTREADKVADAVKDAWDKDLNLPSLVDSYLESGMF